MFNELKNSVKSLSSQLAEIHSVSFAMKSDIFTIQERVSVLKFASKSDSLLPYLLNKILEREKSLCNIVVHGLLESSSRATDDISKLNETIQSLSMSTPLGSKLLRLGRPNNTKMRFLKVIFSTKKQTFIFFVDFKAVKCFLGANNKLQTMHISRDRTLLEWQEIRHTYQELDYRTKQGEFGITIKYRNGFLHIVKNS